MQKYQLHSYTTQINCLKLLNKKMRKINFFLINFIKEWKSTRECDRNGFNQGAVAACCRGELKTYKGFLWEYK